MKRTRGPVMRLTVLIATLWLAMALHQSTRAEGRPIPWWEAETAMGPGGSLILTSTSWWRRARQLGDGEYITLRSIHANGGLMLVRREHLTRRNGATVDAMIWIIDDDGDMQPAARDGDRDSDCYVIDYGMDGTVDRIVDYLDNNRDGRFDEMEIRYFQKGHLRRSWFGLDLDEDGHIWDLCAFEYSGDFFRSDPYGNNMIYMNEYDPAHHAWVPSCECPFAFFDTDSDGESEVAIRVSGVPLDFNPRNPFDMDYGNAVFGYRGPFTERMRNPGALNIRYSRDLDGLSSPEHPLHYDMGFNLTGQVPYKFEGMAHHNPLRRPPKTTNVIPYKDLIHLAEHYPALQTGFSWREYGDDAVALGFGRHAGEDRRWEGVFWTWSRRFMHNTGGPTQHWNMRREFCPTPSDQRQLYYCRADHRIHLKGATDGWICVGHLGNTAPWGEVRMFDSDGDGYFDRWETYRTGISTPARVSTVRDPGIRDLPGDWDALEIIYTRNLLPAALKANQILMMAMGRLDDFKVPEHLTRSMEAASCDTERFFVQDVIRESQYIALRVALSQQNGTLFERLPAGDLRRKPTQLDTSMTAWKQARLISALDTAYAEGRYEDAAAVIDELAVLFSDQASE